jgi:chitinase
MKIRRRSIALVAGATALLTAAAFAVAPNSQAAPASSMGAAPYLYYGWGKPPNATSVMSATGVKWFTLAFILSDGGCNPKWDGNRSLTGSDATRINEIRGAGGDVIPSIGGWSGKKLGEHCSSASALAGAYQKVINTYKLKAIDVDIESTEFNNGTVRKRVIDALKIIKNNNAGIKVYLTFGTTPSGPDATGRDLINKGAAAGLAVDGWVIMPFDFGTSVPDMGKASIKAANGLKAAVKSAYGYSDDQAYRRIGISSMNGKDDDGKTINLGDFREMLAFAKQRHIARFTYWALNRDRSCGGANNDMDSCSGVSQKALDFTRVIGQYNG